jgi:hypothetical protein
MRGTMCTKHQLRKGYSTMIISSRYNHRNYSDSTEVTLRVVVSYIYNNNNNMSIIIIEIIRGTMYTKHRLLEWKGI